MVNETTEEVQTLEETQDSPLATLESRLASYEAAQQLSQRQIQQLTAAVGRAQSLADKLDKTGDPRVEGQVRSAMADIYEMLGTVTDNIDPAILPEAAKARVGAAREAARQAATQADTEAKIAAAVAAALPQAPQAGVIDTDAIEAAVVAQITSLGLDQTKLDWTQAATLLHGAGQPAMWKFIADWEKTQMTTEPIEDDDEPRGPVRRPRTSPIVAGTGASRNSLDVFMDVNTPLDEKIRIARENNISL